MKKRSEKSSKPAVDALGVVSKPMLMGTISAE